MGPPKGVRGALGNTAEKCLSRVKVGTPRLGGKNVELGPATLWVKTTPNIIVTHQNSHFNSQWMGTYWKVLPFGRFGGFCDVPLWCTCEQHNPVDQHLQMGDRSKVLKHSLFDA